VKTVLVVDDEPVIRSLIAAGLSGPGCTVEGVTDGEAALDRARQSSPDLILLDIGLPGINGHEVVRRLKMDPRTAAIPVLYLTGLEPAATDGVEGVVEGVIAKPFTIPTLRTATARWLKES
jgi:CheY-like chemotaxis protein